MPLGATAVAVVGLLSLLVLGGIAAFDIVRAVRRGGRREDTADPCDALSFSRFTMPVSVIVADEGTTSLSDRLESLLALEYPQFEVIVVTDGCDSPTMDGLRSRWDLQPREVFYRRTISTAPVRRICVSSRDARLIVVEKERAGLADAWNCGLSLARFRYVTLVPPDATYERRALLQLMTAVLRDPSAIVTVASHIETRDPTDWIGRMQRIDSIRSWMTSHLQTRGWRECPSNCATVWRREAVLELGGFATESPDPTSDMFARITAATDRSTGVLVNSDIVGAQPARSLREAARISGVGRRRGRAVRLLTNVALLALAGGAVSGVLSWGAFLLGVAAVVFGDAAVTAAALLMRGALPGGPSTTEIRRLLLVAPVQSLLYRPAVALARLFGPAVAR